MRYFDYFIKCIIRNFVRLFIKPICIVIVVFLVFVLFMFVDSVFGVDSLAFTQLSSGIWNDKAISNGVVIEYNGLHGRQCYLPPNCKGTIQLNFSSNEFHCAFFTATKSGDIGIGPQIGDIPVISYHFSTQGLVSFDTTQTSFNEYGAWFVFYSVDYTGNEAIPYYDTFQDYSSVGIVDSQQQTTQAIQQQTNVINSINSSLTDSTVDNNAINIDVSDLDFDDSQGIDSFFTNFINNKKDVFSNISNEVETIEIPLPYTDNKLVLSSDLLSKHIVNTSLYNLIQVFWWFLIGSYIIVFCRRIIVWFTSGEIAERGPASFIRYLDKNNEIIKTYMM